MLVPPLILATFSALIAALFAAQDAGSDARGLFSAALLIVGPDRAPLTLRIDHSDDPLPALRDLLARPLLLDGRNIWSGYGTRKMGFTYEGVGVQGS